jgi:hypothetical protein
MELDSARIDVDSSQILRSFHVPFRRLAELQSNKAQEPIHSRSQNHPILSPRVSILSPPISTSHTLYLSTRFQSSEPLFKTHLIKSSHRLISTPNLHLEECCFFPIASFLRTLHLRFLCIIPSSGSTKNIFSLLPREVLALVVSLLEYVLVGTSLAFEAVYGFMGVSVARGSGSSRGDCEDIAARGAD